ncbi:hypothetical protein [Streptomyces sp. NPDC048341]|uniref:hypothetical protein n=1 Tax=unclassified Streptomyces TaxID=2593676 RepID=UPI0034461661
MRIDGGVPDGATEITTGQANRVWHIGGREPYILKHYSDPARAANEAAALALLTHHRAPSPRLLHTDVERQPAWTAQSVVHGEPVPVDQFLDGLVGPLAAVHAIPETHFGRLAGAARHYTWRAYLHDRLNLYTVTAPGLVTVAAALRQDLDRVSLDIEPRLLHHDLQSRTPRPRPRGPTATAGLGTRRFRRSDVRPRPPRRTSTPALTSARAHP